MKKIITAFAFSLTTISYSQANTFTDPIDSINKKVVESFNKDFSNAHNINWERKNYFVLATFSLNNQVMFAYYTIDGVRIAVTRNILSDKLPITLLLSLKKDYQNHWISDLYEVNSNNNTIYYITIENANYKLELKSVNDGNWEIFAKEEKE